MSLKHCIVCLHTTVYQSDHEDLSGQLLPDFRDALTAISKLNNLSTFAKKPTFCTRCQLFLIRVTKLNTKLKTLVCTVKQAYDTQSVKIRAVLSIHQSILGADEDTCGTQQHEGNQSDEQSDKGSSSSISGMQSVERSDSEAQAGNCSESSHNIEEDVDTDSLCSVEVTTEAPAQGDDTFQLTAKGYPKVQKSKHFQRCVQVAPNRFQYGKYLIQKVGGRYKCGECVALKKPAKPHKIQFIMKHITDQHENSSRSYVCEYCGVVYNALGSLAVHKITKHGDPNGKFPCSDCGNIFRNRIALFGHQHSVHRKKPREKLTCEPCGKQFNRKDYFDDHVAIVHNGQKRHECQECGKKFGTNVGLKNHQNLHPGNRKYLYNTSGTQSVEENRSSDHSRGTNLGAAVDNVEEHSNEVNNLAPKTNGAGSCLADYQDNWLPKNLTLPKSAQDVKRLSERDFIYKDEYPFHGTEFGLKCGLCNVVVVFGTYRTNALWFNIIKHFQRWHIGDGGAGAATSVRQLCIEVAPNRFQYGNYCFEKVDGMFKCGECGLLKKPEKPNGDGHRPIVKHIVRQHANSSRTYDCKDCGAVYRNPRSLRNHKIAKHENPSGQFLCSDCGKIFGCLDKLTTHRRRFHHKDPSQNKFICEICGKNYTTKDAMKHHVAFFHNGQRLECKDCGKMFASQNALATHRNSHRGKKYTCDICGMEFTQHYSVTRHKKTAHP